MASIKPCPFCGKTKSIFVGTAEEIEGRTIAGCAENQYAVVCDFVDGGCGSGSGYKDTKEEAIALWNTRMAEDNNNG